EGDALTASMITATLLSGPNRGTPYRHLESAMTPLYPHTGDSFVSPAHIAGGNIQVGRAHGQRWIKNLTQRECESAQKLRGQIERQTTKDRRPTTRPNRQIDRISSGSI